MKALRKLFGELVAWRWAPAVGLCVASLFYVIVVVALVPDEIGVPVTNARFAKKVTPTPAEVPEAPTFPTAVVESETPPPQPAPVRTAGVVDFGRRGFSPPLERPEPPPAPVVPPPPPPLAPPPVAVAPPVAAPPPEVPGAVEPGEEQTATPAPLPPQQHSAPGGIFRALRSVLPGHQPPGGPPNAPPPGAEPPASEAPPTPPTPPAAPDEK